jgi:hypothetical protein
MTRRILAALAACLLLPAACGKYGRPVRSSPASPAAAAEDSAAPQEPSSQQDEEEKTE